MNTYTVKLEVVFNVEADDENDAMNYAERKCNYAGAAGCKAYDARKWD